MASVVYDTKEIRRYARQFKRCADEINAEAATKLKSAAQKTSGNIEGSTADAMEERFVQLNADAKKLVSQLTAMYNGLMRFADSLEEKDAQIARMMGH